jgi:hypothetical protein
MLIRRRMPQDPIPIPKVSQIAKNHTPPITPSSRSMTPPWPGISRLASLTPNRRLTADSSRSPPCEKTAMPRLRSAILSGLQPTARPNSRPARPAAASPPAAPDQVLPGLTRGQSWPADAATDEIGADVGRDHDQHQPEDEHSPGAFGRAAPAAPRRGSCRGACGQAVSHGRPATARRSPGSRAGAGPRGGGDD